MNCGVTRCIKHQDGTCDLTKHSRSQSGLDPFPTMISTSHRNFEFWKVVPFLEGTWARSSAQCCCPVRERVAAAHTSTVILSPGRVQLLFRRNSQESRRYNFVFQIKFLLVNFPTYPNILSACHILINEIRENTCKWQLLTNNDNLWFGEADSIASNITHSPWNYCNLPLLISWLGSHSP